MSAVDPDDVVLVADCYLGNWARAHQSAKRATDANALFYFADDADIEPLVAHQTRVGRGAATPGKRFRLFLVAADDDAPDESAEPEPPRAYGDCARQLRLSGFLRAPAVWRCLGSDADFRAWVSYQHSVVSGAFNEVDAAGAGRCVAAHVRRAGAAGTAHKPAYACVALTDDEHRYQHDHGEAALLAAYNVAAPDGAAAWFDTARVRCVADWAWARLKQALGTTSMAATPPDAVTDWAEAHGVDVYLPTAYHRSNR